MLLIRVAVDALNFQSKIKQLLVREKKVKLKEEKNLHSGAKSHYLLVKPPCPQADAFRPLSHHQCVLWCFLSR